MMIDMLYISASVQSLTPDTLHSASKHYYLLTQVGLWQLFKAGVDLRLGCPQSHHNIFDTLRVLQKYVKS